MLGVSGARNPLPTGSPSWGSRIGRAKPSAPRPQPCPQASSAAQRRGPIAPMARKNLLAAAFCKGKLSSGSKPQPQRASDRESNASRFRPRPHALHSAKRGWPAPGSLGPAALLGVSSARNLVPMSSPSWGGRIGRAKKFCAQSPAMPPVPARPLSAEAPSHRRPQTSFWQLHSAKGNSRRAANHSPNAPRIEKATQAVFAPVPLLSIGRTGAALPRLPGPCCFAGGLRCPKPTPHGFSFVGKQDWAPEAFYAQAPAMPPEPARPLSA